MQDRTVRAIIEDQELLTAVAATSVTEAARSMRERRVGAILIVEGDRLVGIFTERDALFRVVAEGRDPGRTPIGDVMTRDPKTIRPDQPFGRALGIMHEGRFRHVPVVENGRPVGMVSARDALGPELEHFVFGFLAEEQARDVLA